MSTRINYFSLCPFIEIRCLQPKDSTDKEVAKVHDKFIQKSGDQLTLLQAFNWFVASDQTQKWCDETT